MNRLHVLVLLAAMACTGLVMGTVKAEAADSGKELRAAVNATAPPFAFMENGKLVGFEVDLHAGEESATMWTCDFSHEYVTINGDYRS